MLNKQQKNALPNVSSIFAYKRHHFWATHPTTNGRWIESYVNSFLVSVTHHLRSETLMIDALTKQQNAVNADK